MRQARTIPVDRSQIRTLTESVVREITDFVSPFLRRGEAKYDLQYQRGFDARKTLRAGFYTGRDVTGSGFSIPVFIDFKENVRSLGTSRDLIPLGGLYQQGYPGKRFIPRSVTLTVNSAASVEDILDQSRLRKQVQSVLLHEITHASDWMVAKKPRKRTRAEYINAPEEIRARIPQIAEEILPTDLRVDVALRGSEIWKSIRDDLTEDNRKRILKTLSVMNSRARVASVFLGQKRSGMR